MNMINSEIIQERQNEEAYLKIQYAARVCFNSAERYNHLAWIACLISAFSIFLPNSWSIYILTGIPFCADIVAAIFSFASSYRVRLASDLRKYFDSYVLNIGMNQFSETELRKLREQTERICLRNQNEVAVQIANTGKDTPPGVREWYVFSKFYDGIAAQFECQRQNTWWNSKMFQRRTGITIILLVILGSAFLVLAINNSVLNVILCSAGILLKFFERLVENCRYISVSRLIDGSLQTIEVHPTEEGIAQLQTFIDERRSINVLEFDQIHKRIARKLSEMYEKTAL